MMDFNEYQRQALTTALPTALNLDYLVPGLIAEIGEVFGKEAKAVRDGWDKDRLDREVCAELADCLWFVAVIAHVAGTPPMSRVACCGLNDSMRLATNMYAWDMTDYPRYLGQILKQITKEAEKHGSTLEDLARANLGKLASRKLRGALSGSGDDR